MTWAMYDVHSKNLRMSTMCKRACNIICSDFYSVLFRQLLSEQVLPRKMYKKYTWVMFVKLCWVRHPQGKLLSMLVKI